MSLTFLGRSLLRRPVLSSCLGAATSSTDPGSLLHQAIDLTATSDSGSDCGSRSGRDATSGLSSQRLGEQLLHHFSLHNSALAGVGLAQPSPQPFAAAEAHAAAAPGTGALFRLPHGHMFISLGAAEPRGSAVNMAVLPVLNGMVEAPVSAPAAADASGGEAMQCISTKTWRRLKMKKHKIRKRRRLVRHQGKK